MLPLISVSPAAQPFLAVVLARLFAERPVVVVTDGLKTQEIFQQDIQTWLSSNKPKDAAPSPACLFYPAWETLPHESKLPHVDVISDRLETLLALQGGRAKNVLVVTNVVALLQKTFRPGDLEKRTRRFHQGDVADPLDLIEWLEDQGYEPETQVTQQGAIALRGGILDLWPLTSPWPVRLEFFGSELTSLRYFDPITQISKEEITSLAVPPGGEIGILKQLTAAGAGEAPISSLLEHLPENALFVLCEPEALAEQAQRYAAQAPEGDPFFIPWNEFQNQMRARGVAILEVSDAGMDEPDLLSPRETEAEPELKFQGLEVFRPIGERPPEPHIAEAQRKEFFGQLHRWSRQDYELHVFCNNDGERQRFEEIWWEYGLGNAKALNIQIGTLARGFLFEAAKLAVVTDAEIFGRYRVQRPRRLKSARAQTSKSLLDINFAELEEGDYVVHLQHGIGRYLGLQVMPAAQGRKPLQSGAQSTDSAEECLVIEYASGDPAQQPPKLYVPVSEAHLVGKYVGAGKARPQLNTLGGTRWAKTKAQAEIAVRDLAGEMLSIQAARESQVGHAFPDRHRVAAGV